MKKVLLAITLSFFSASVFANQADLDKQAKERFFHNNAQMLIKAQNERNAGIKNRKVVCDQYGIVKKVIRSK